MFTVTCMMLHWVVMVFWLLFICITAYSLSMILRSAYSLSLVDDLAIGVFLVDDLVFVKLRCDPRSIDKIFLIGAVFEESHRHFQGLQIGALCARCCFLLAGCCLAA